MQDQRINMLKTFGSYSLAFNTLEPTKVETFFHLTSKLMTSDQVGVNARNGINCTLSLYSLLYLA
jgi:hypothetical protein